jgi:ADP-ribosyl-[dinitrogen reductase] hydrolase
MDMFQTDAKRGMVLGGFIGDAHAMPVHWYYDLAALRRDHGRVTDYLAPRNPHPDSILWRSRYTAPCPRGEILHDQARYWGQRGVHYHQHLAAGENTLNLQLAVLLLESLHQRGGYQADDYLDRYIRFMTEPGHHRDTYIEECHRNFFSNLARGRTPRRCGEPDIHIGGLAHVGILCAAFGEDPSRTREIVREHIGLTHPDPSLLHAADALTAMLCAVLQGTTLRDAIAEHGRDHFSAKRSEKLAGEPDENVIGRVFSPACYIRDAFPATLHLAWKYADRFEAGILANTNVGGDNCHRGAVLGSLLGGASGEQSLHRPLVDGLKNRECLHRLLSPASAAKAG